MTKKRSRLTTDPSAGPDVGQPAPSRRSRKQWRRVRGCTRVLSFGDQFTNIRARERVPHGQRHLGSE